MSVYLELFKSKEDIEAEYECKVPDGSEVLMAWYGYGSYCGDSLVLYRLESNLYEVNGGHCSCHGLEGQWIPEETTVAALKMRALYTQEDGEYSGWDEAHKRFVEIVDSLDGTRGQ